MGDVAKEIDYIACQLLQTWQQSSKTFPYMLSSSHKVLIISRTIADLGAGETRTGKKKIG